MGYYVGEPVRDSPTILPRLAQGQAELRMKGKIETFDRATGAGPKVTETSTIGIRYEIKTADGAVIENNRKSNTGNSNLMRLNLRESEPDELKSIIREGILGMAQGGTRKVVVSPVGIKINGTWYEEPLTIGWCLVPQKFLVLRPIRCKGCGGAVNPWSIVTSGWRC